MTVKEKKFVTGRVIQNTQDKTISVLVERKVKHPVLGKFISKSKNTRFIMKAGQLLSEMRLRYESVGHFQKERDGS